MAEPYRIRSISEFHRLRGLPGPAHPLISVVDYADVSVAPKEIQSGLVLDYYSISVKRNPDVRINYGQQEYDFDSGVMFFMAPGQVFNVTPTRTSGAVHSGWMLLVHPDFLWGTPMAKEIRQCEIFDYSVNEALFLSEKEEAILAGIVQNIKNEYHSNIDKFTQGIILSQLGTLLSYGERFYQRQFITRKAAGHRILDALETLLSDYFDGDDLETKGLPAVQWVADELNISPGYLSGLLKTLTGRSTQQHIQDKLIEKAKERLSTTGLSVAEIAYGLGFGHPQSFSKLFKTKTSLSPLEFRQSFIS
jgi:AraC family transcriptional regulator, transcriptional activator of pobA